MGLSGPIVFLSVLVEAVVYVVGSVYTRVVVGSNLPHGRFKIDYAGGRVAGAQG